MLKTTRPYAYGVVGGALVWWVVLALGFGWMSNGTAQQMAKQQTHDALVVAVSPVCAYRFESQANFPIAWRALKKADGNFNQQPFLEGGFQKINWILLPGMALPSGVADDVADACANQVLALTSYKGVKLASAAH